MSLGHDAAVSSIKKRNAYLAITCRDSSDRLKREIKDECSFDGRDIPYVDANFDMKELSLCIGSRAGIITIDDKGFAERLYRILVVTGGYVNG